jgi:hypothetical protein
MEEVCSAWADAGQMIGLYLAPCLVAAIDPGGRRGYLGIDVPLHYVSGPEVSQVDAVLETLPTRRRDVLVVAERPEMQQLMKGGGEPDAAEELKVFTLAMWCPKWKT